MEARIQEGDGVRGTSITTGAMTFNAPGLSQSLRGQGPLGTMTSHQLTVAGKIRNRSNYTNITNHRIAKRDGNLRVSNPTAIWGFNLGSKVDVRSVNNYGSFIDVNYHGLAEFFDILRVRDDFVR
jgi:hypothetical protein